MGFWKKLREFDKRGVLMERVEGPFGITKKGYVVDRRVFRVYMALVVALIAYIMFTSGVGWNEVYVACPLDHMGECENPCYLGGDKCGALQFQEYIAPGTEFGRLPPPEYESQKRGLWWFIVCGFVLAFSINHMMHNRGKSIGDLFPDVEV
jgi:hypothetical protein